MSRYPTRVKVYDEQTRQVIDTFKYIKPWKQNEIAVFKTKNKTNLGRMGQEFLKALLLYFYLLLISTVV